MPQEPFPLKYYFTDITISPYIRIVKILGVSLSIVFSIIFLIILGYRGRGGQRLPVPETIKNLSEHSIPILLYFNYLSGLGIYFFSILNDTYPTKRIIIDGHFLNLWLDQKRKNINLRQADRVTFKVMPFFHKLFNDRFHRIGRLVVKDKNKKQVYYFPLRNEAIAQEMADAISSFRKVY
ncbi:MAG: hypothetical protein EBR30_15220 [Cytophagia bacterium]|nr:hypothetical protein [Cytophagia bacterium]